MFSWIYVTAQARAGEIVMIESASHVYIIMRVPILTNGCVTVIQLSRRVVGARPSEEG